MPKKRVEVGNYVNFRDGDVIVGKAPSSTTWLVEREVPLPDVQPGDMVRYFWDKDLSKNVVEEVAKVNNDRITFVAGGWIFRNPADTAGNFPPYVVYRKVEQKES